MTTREAQKPLIEKLQALELVENIKTDALQAMSEPECRVGADQVVEAALVAWREMNEAWIEASLAGVRPATLRTLAATHCPSHPGLARR